MELPADDSLAVDVVAAIREGDLVRLRRLLAEQPGLATARIVDAKGVARTLLHVVADWPGHFPNGALTVAALIAAGADVDASLRQANPEGSPETALHWAASSDDVAVLDALLDGGADAEAPGAVFTGGTAMSDAVVFAQWRAARRLLERGATTTFWQAAGLGLRDRVRGHLDEATPSAEELTSALWHACCGGHQETVALLVDRGADVNWIGYDRKTPLDVAVECEAEGRDDLIEWLRARGAKSEAELGTAPQE